MFSHKENHISRISTPGLQKKCSVIIIIQLSIKICGRLFSLLFKCQYSFASWLPKPDLRAVWPYRKKMATSDLLKYHSFFKINFKSCFYLKSLHTDSPLRNWNLRPGLRFGSKPSDPPPCPGSSLPGAARQSLTTWTTQNMVSWGVRNSPTPMPGGRGPGASSTMVANDDFICLANSTLSLVIWLDKD